VGLVILDDFIQSLFFALIGGLGGATHAIIWAKSWEDVKKFGFFKKSILGVMAGFLYSLAYTRFDLPNSLVVWMVGYFGQSFIIGLTKRFKGQYFKDTNDEG